MSQSAVFLGALATHKLVGRKNELQALEAAIAPADTQSFQCLVLEARGGMGKTRLLRETYERLTAGESSNPSRGVWIKEDVRVVALDLIDLAEVAFHPVVGFLREVRQRFAAALPNHSAVFAGFDAAWLSYEQARDGELDFAEVARRTASLIAAFEQNYAAVTLHTRVVWLLDTLEQLFAVPLEIAEYLDVLGVKSEDLGLTTYSWLLEFTRLAPQQTTLLLAGRPEPGRWVADVRAALPTGDPPPLQVANFTPEETDFYLTYLCEQLGRIPNLGQRAQDLRKATDEPHEIANLHRLTGGNPIRLALYIDLFFNADMLPEPFGDPASTAELTESAIATLRDQLDSDLLDYLTTHLADPEPQVLEYLSVMRRGLDRARLRMLWGPTDDSAIDDVFTSLQRLSFIKVRGEKGSETLFLHDEFYTIYQRNLSRQDSTRQEAERERQREIFARLIEFSQQRSLQLVQALYAIQTELATLEVEQPSYLATKERFRALRAERRRFRVERVHYALYNEPKSGLNNMFFRVAGQAFLANEPDLDELLQSEVTTFFFGGGQELNRQQTGASEADWQLLRFHVLHERVARWIRRLTLKIQREQAQELAERASANHRELLARFYPDLTTLYDHPDGALVSRMFVLEWTACRWFAAIFAGKDLRAPLEGLQKLTQTIEGELTLDQQQPDGPLHTRLKTFRWRLLNILAECLLFRGFAQANLYEFKTAEELYKRANKILDKTEFSTLQSEVKNGLARVLGERGALFEALALCDDALDVRERNGFDLLRGLSRNTLALINTRNARPTRALEHATIALSFFRQLNNPRAIALALIQVAEAKRRMWNLKAEELRYANAARSRVDRGLLKDVDPILSEAEQLFGVEFRSEARLAEIWIEWGSLYRDWAGFFGLSEAHAELERAQKLYTDAMNLAAQDGYRYRQHYLSACVNLVYVHTQAKQPEKAEEMAAVARAFVKPSYKFSTAGPVDVGAGDVTNFRELSKLHALYARYLLPKDQLEARLREYIFSVTAMQLFSPYNPYYLEVNKRELTSFTTTNFKSAQQKQALVALTAKVIREYHLDSIEGALKSLQAKTVIEEVTQQGEELEYLID